MNEHQLSEEAIADSELISRYRKTGDKKALGQLFEKHMDLSFYVAMGYLKNRTSAEDAVQNAFIKVMNSSESYSERKGSVKTWLTRIVVNTCYNVSLEDKRRSKRHLVKASEQSSVYNPKENSDDLSDHVVTSMNQLPELYRMPVWLRFCENLSYKEISEALDRPEKTVQSQVNRGLEKMKSSIAAAGVRVASVSIISALVTLKLEAAPKSLKATITRNTFNESVKNNSLHNTAVDTAGNLKPTLTFGKLALGVAILLVSTTIILTLISKSTDESSASKPPSTTEESYHWSFEEPASTEVFEVIKGSWQNVQKKGMSGSNCMLTSREYLDVKINIPLAGKPIHLSFQTKFYRNGKESARLPSIETFAKIYIHHRETTTSKRGWDQFDIYLNGKAALIKINGKDFIFYSIQPNKSGRILLVAYGMWLFDDLHIEALSAQDELQFDPYLNLIDKHLSDISTIPTRFDLQIHDKKESVYVFYPTGLLKITPQDSNKK